MFAGKTLEELDLAFTIVDDIYMLRKNITEETGINDRSEEHSTVIPNYQKYVLDIRTDLRKSNYLKYPYLKGIGITSIKGEKLNPNLMNIFDISQKTRQSDILHAYSYSDFLQAYNPVNKVSIIADDNVKKKGEKDIQRECLILIHMMEDDPDAQIELRDIFEKVKKDGRDALQKFFDLIVVKDISTIYESFK